LIRANARHLDRGWNYFERLVAAAGIVPAPAVDAALATVAEYQSPGFTGVSVL
jgi:hypothetical protein